MVRVGNEDAACFMLAEEEEVVSFGMVMPFTGIVEAERAEGLVTVLE